MLKSSHTQVGVTLIELIVGLSIMAILVVAGTPSLVAWVQNSQVRTSAESIANGLQLARGEAVRRNTPVRFQFTSTMGNDCALSTAAGNWVVSLINPAGACASAPSETADPRIIQASSAAGSAPNAVVAADQALIAFNGLGRINPVPAGNININVSNPTGGACLAAGGKTRCLRVVVSAMGQIQLCDPAISGANPQACP